MVYLRKLTAEEVRELAAQLKELREAKSLHFDEQMALAELIAIERDMGGDLHAKAKEMLN